MKNIYSSCLEDWYTYQYNSRKEFLGNQSSHLTMTLEYFNKTLRHISINFGLAADATTSIIKFLHDHPELAVAVIHRNNVILKMFEESYNQYGKPNKYHIVDNYSINNIDSFQNKTYNYDLIIFDSCCSEDLCTYLYNTLNIKLEDHQWIISLGGK